MNHKIIKIESHPTSLQQVKHRKNKFQAHLSLLLVHGGWCGWEVKIHKKSKTKFQFTIFSRVRKSVDKLNSNRLGVKYCKKIPFQMGIDNWKIYWRKL